MNLRLKRAVLTAVPIKRLLMGFLAAVIAAYITASLLQSFFVLNALEAAGANFSLKLWVHTLWHDLYGLAFGGKYVSYGKTIVMGFAIALPVAALCHKFIPLPRALIYSLAGATAMATILTLVKINFYDLTLFAGTRGSAGFSAQLIAGALGGFAFAAFSHPHSVKSSSRVTENAA